MRATRREIITFRRKKLTFRDFCYENQSLSIGSWLDSYSFLVNETIETERVSVLQIIMLLKMKPCSLYESWYTHCDFK